MATFPDLPIGFDTDLKADDFKRVTVMKDHSLVIQKDSSTAVYSGNIICIHLTSADKTTLEDFYSINKDINFDFVNPHDGVTYSLYFTNLIKYVREAREATELFIAIVPVIGYAT